MTVSQAVTYRGSVVTIGGTDVSDELTAYTLTPDSRLESVATFSNGRVAAPGVTTYSGEITCVYDNTSGSAYLLLRAESTTYSGGLAIVFRPEGTGTGNEEITATCIFGEAPVEATADGGIQLRTFPFEVTGSVTYANQ